MKEEDQDIEKPAAKASHKYVFPWKRSLKDRMFAFLLTDAFRTGTSKDVHSMLTPVTALHWSRSVDTSDMYYFWSYLGVCKRKRVSLSPQYWAPACPSWRAACAGLQLAVGQFGVSLFPLVPRMRFSQDCLAATLYLVCSLLISQSNNMGDKFIGCVSLIGPALLAAVIGGCVVS